MFQSPSLYARADQARRALDQLGPLPGMAYELSPGWLKIDADFDPPRKNPRFQKLVRRREVVPAYSTAT